MDIKTILADCELFAGVSNVLIAELTLLCKERHYRGGETIFEIGSKGNEVFVVPEGPVSLELHLPGNVVTETLDLAMKNDVFGELALVQDFRRSAEAIALNDLTLLEFNKDALLSLLKARPEAGFQVMSNLARIIGRKLVNTNSRLRAALI